MSCENIPVTWTSCGAGQFELDRSPCSSKTTRMRALSWKTMAQRGNLNSRDWSIYTLPNVHGYLPNTNLALLGLLYSDHFVAVQQTQGVEGQF